jgi:ABC-type thiamine transport system substrate-binding protein
MKKSMRVVALVLAALLSAAAAAETLQPGSVYYYNSFDPATKPWNPGTGLNIEEVFKNYLYYEIVVDKTGQGITVNRYIQNVRERSDKYLIRPDGSLEAK